MVQIYTDGGNSLKHKVGGCAAIVTREGVVLAELVETYSNRPTNNMMELGGAIIGLDYMLQHPELGKDVEIISDSEYVVLGASERVDAWKARGWKNSCGRVKNKVLWEAIVAIKKELNIKWTWVKGHNDNEFNERADRLLVKEYTKLIK